MPWASWRRPTPAGEGSAAWAGRHRALAYQLAVIVDAVLRVGGSACVVHLAPGSGRTSAFGQPAWASV
eukprot:504263-Lingulodinium_polyedra.AAC.1